MPIETTLLREGRVLLLRYTDPFDGREALANTERYIREVYLPATQPIYSISDFTGVTQVRLNMLNDGLKILHLMPPIWPWLPTRRLPTGSPTLWDKCLPSRTLPFTARWTLHGLQLMRCLHSKITPPQKMAAAHCRDCATAYTRCVRNCYAPRAICRYNERIVYRPHS